MVATISFSRTRRGSLPQRLWPLSNVWVAIKPRTSLKKAVEAIGGSGLTEEAIDTVMTSDDEQRLAKLNRCDDAYYKNAEPIAERLFEFIKANRVGITL